MTSMTSDRTGPVASGAWKTRHSLWLLAPVLGFGVLSFVGFVYCAFRIRRGKWIVLATVSVVLTVLGWIFLTAWTGPTGDPSTASIVYVIELWLASIIFGLVVNRDYLLWRSNRGTSAQLRGDHGAPRGQGLSPSAQYRPVGYGIQERPAGGEPFVAPGWYDDPHSDDLVRWWTGYTWTAGTAPRPRSLGDSDDVD